jgi:hypothetical protein
MKQPLHLAVECLMAAKERPVELADLDGRKSAKLPPEPWTCLLSL